MLAGVLLHHSLRILTPSPDTTRVAYRCAPGQLFTAELPHEKVKLTADLVTFTALEHGRDKTKHCAQLHLIGQLVALLELFHCHGDTDVLHTANKLLLHGTVPAVLRCAALCCVVLRVLRCAALCCVVLHRAASCHAMTCHDVPCCMIQICTCVYLYV